MNLTGGPLKPAFGLSGELHFWQKRYYDFNIRNYSQFVEKLRYIHRNPARAGLGLRPEDSEWSSFRHCNWLSGSCADRVETGLRESAKGRQGDSVRLWNCHD